jgi:hypothetical protein
MGSKLKYISQTLKHRPSSHHQKKKKKVGGGGGLERRKINRKENELRILQLATEATWIGSLKINQLNHQCGLTLKKSF